MPVPTVTMPYMSGRSVVVISTERAHLMQRITSGRATGRSMLARTELAEMSELEEEYEEP